MHERKYVRTLQGYGATWSTVYVRTYAQGPFDFLTPGLVLIVTGTGLRSCIRGAVPGFGLAPASALAHELEFLVSLSGLRFQKSDLLH